MSRHANWMRALDIQMDTLKWYRSDHGQGFTHSYMMSMYRKGLEADGRDIPIEQETAFREFVWDDVKIAVETLHRGDTCYITSEMMHLVTQAAHDMRDNEIHIDFRNLMTPVGFVLMEEGIYGYDGEGKYAGFHAIGWNNLHVTLNPDTDEMERSLEIYFFSDMNDIETNGSFRRSLEKHDMGVPPMSILHVYRCFDNHLIEHIGEDELPGSAIVEELLKVFYSIQLLSHQNLAQTVEARPDRAARKRFKREHPDEPERLITLITLRRKTAKKDDGEPAKVEWSRRWVVRGFWRRQWYPKSKRHDWKYIHEYIKGPEDKPLVITERRVFDFRR